MNTFSIHQAQMAVFSTSLAQQGGFPASTLTRPPPQWAPLVWSNVCLSWASEIVSCWSLFQPSICPASATLFVSGGRPTSVPSVTPLPSPTPSPQQLTLKLTRSFCKKKLIIVPVETGKTITPLFNLQNSFGLSVSNTITANQQFSIACTSDYLIVWVSVFDHIHFSHQELFF